MFQRVQELSLACNGSGIGAALDVSRFEGDLRTFVYRGENGAKFTVEASHDGTTWVRTGVTLFRPAMQRVRLPGKWLRTVKLAGKGTSSGSCNVSGKLEQHLVDVARPSAVWVRPADTGPGEGTPFTVFHKIPARMAIRDVWWCPVAAVAANATNYATVIARVMNILGSYELGRISTANASWTARRAVNLPVASGGVYQVQADEWLTVEILAAGTVVVPAGALSVRFL